MKGTNIGIPHMYVPRGSLNNATLRDNLKKLLDDLGKNIIIRPMPKEDSHICLSPTYEQFIKEMDLEEKFKVWARVFYEVKEDQ